MDVNKPLQLLGGLSPQQFMKRHWQKKPLLVRQAIKNFQPLLARAALFDLAGEDDVQARLVRQTANRASDWRLSYGPFQRRALPPLKQPGWTLLLQGVDLASEEVHALLHQFRFVPDARLDDLMISYASDGGGVGPHFDSYDVFLLQAQGQRRWRIGRQKDLSLQADVPLKILANFEPKQEFVLEPGDMLYLPPRYAHDGVAVGECMTYSIGFRAPGRGELARELLQRLADDAADAVGDGLYRDPAQCAVAQPAEIPAQLLTFAREALEAALQDPDALACTLGAYLTEPKPHVWFETSLPTSNGGVRLNRRTRMMFDTRHIFINGEGFRADGRDARLMRRLADERCLGHVDVARLSAQARNFLHGWVQAGWAHGE